EVSRPITSRQQPSHCTGVEQGSTCGSCVRVAECRVAGSNIDDRAADPAGDDCMDPARISLIDQPIRRHEGSAQIHETARRQHVMHYPSMLVRSGFCSQMLLRQGAVLTSCAPGEAKHLLKPN